MKKQVQTMLARLKLSRYFAWTNLKARAQKKTKAKEEARVKKDKIEIICKKGHRFFQSIRHHIDRKNKFCNEHGISLFRISKLHFINSILTETIFPISI